MRQQFDQPGQVFAIPDLGYAVDVSLDDRMQDCLRPIAPC
jgi:hypothetical protein